MRRGKPKAISSRLIASESSATDNLPTKCLLLQRGTFAAYLTFFFRTRQSLIHRPWLHEIRMGNLTALFYLLVVESRRLQCVGQPLGLKYQIGTYRET